MESKINTALLSYGMSGLVFHGPLLTAHPGFEIKAVFHRNPAKKITHSFPVVDSAEKIWKDPSIELVIVNTPNDSHFAFASQALAAGKHVIVEKPFTVTSEEAAKLIALAKKNNCILTVFQNRRWDGDFLTIQKVLREKMLGRIVEFEAHYDRYRNYIEANTWKEEAAPGGGILYNLGTHMLDQVLVLFGKPEYVDARVGIQRTEGKVDDFYDIRLQYSGINVIVKSSYLVRESMPRYIIHGTEGSFVKYGIDPQEQDLKDKKLPGGPGWGIEPRQFWGKLNSNLNGIHFDGLMETTPGNYLAFYQSIYDAIRNGKALAVKPEESMLGIQLIEACTESNKLKKAIKI